MNRISGDGYFVLYLCFNNLKLLDSFDDIYCLSLLCHSNTHSLWWCLLIFNANEYTITGRIFTSNDLRYDIFDCPIARCRHDTVLKSQELGVCSLILRRFKSFAASEYLLDIIASSSLKERDFCNCAQ